MDQLRSVARGGQSILHTPLVVPIGRFLFPDGMNMDETKCRV